MRWSLTVWPDRAQYRPGEPVTLLLRVTGPPGCSTVLSGGLSSGVAQLTSGNQPVSLDAAGFAQHRINWQPPATAAAWRAYGVDFCLLGPRGKTLATGSTAFDVAPHWEAAPRYGFLSDFAPTPGQGDASDDDRLDRMRRLHLNCVQFYDWMYRHHTYIAPHSPYTDVLDRCIDLDRVRRRIVGCRRRGIVPVAYGCVYGGEQPFAERHPDWLLYDGAGRPLSLGGVFFIQDPSPESGWRHHLLRQYRAALELGFQGLHCDTYGSPRAGFSHRAGVRRVVRLDAVLPGLVAEADALARSLDPEGGALLNCVGAWPLEEAVRAQCAAHYIEVWPPNTTYRDLYELVQRARRLDPGRQVILAAYLAAFHPERARPAGALNSLRLAAAAIFASGGFYLLPGEGEGVLADPYYPLYGRLNERHWEVLRAYWDFQTRYGPLLAGRDSLEVSTTLAGGSNRECRLEGAPCSPMAEPGMVWMLLRQGPGYQVLHLINLCAVTEPRWNGPQPDFTPVEGLTVRLEVLTEPTELWVATPDMQGGRAVPVDYEVTYEAGTGLVLAAGLPPLRVWSMLVLRWDDQTA